MDLVRVADNGCGIAADELPLAVASHATSKIDEADDLFRVGTLGFRGEALASIAEISRLVIRSRTAAETSGGVADRGHRRPCRRRGPCGCPVGTTVEVHNLFFNTPVRRKFLRTTQTEFGHVSEAFTRIALAAAADPLHLRHNERQVFELPASSRSPAGADRRLLRPRTGRRPDLGRKQRRRACGSPATWPMPSQSRSNNRMQYLFLNGRHIRDHALQHALGEAYRGLLHDGPLSRWRFSPWKCRAELVDVNVHPTKLEVRFQDGGRLYSQLLATLRSKFLTTDLTHPRWPPPGG